MIGLQSHCKYLISLIKPRKYLKEVVGERLTILDSHEIYIGKKKGVRMYFYRPHSTAIDYLDTTNKKIKACMYSLITKTYLKKPVVIITYSRRYSIRKVYDNNA